MIGAGKITLSVLGIQGNRLRIGVDAPKEVSVYREKIYQRIKNDKDPEPSL